MDKNMKAATLCKRLQKALPQSSKKIVELWFKSNVLVEIEAVIKRNNHMLNGRTLYIYMFISAHKPESPARSTHPPI